MTDKEVRKLQRSRLLFKVKDINEFIKDIGTREYNFRAYCHKCKSALGFYTKAKLHALILCPRECRCNKDLGTDTALAWEIAELLRKADDSMKYLKDMCAAPSHFETNDITYEFDTAIKELTNIASIIFSFMRVCDQHEQTDKLGQMCNDTYFWIRTLIRKLSSRLSTYNRDLEYIKYQEAKKEASNDQ